MRATLPGLLPSAVAAATLHDGDDVSDDSKEMLAAGDDDDDSEEMLAADDDDDDSKEMLAGDDVSDDSEETPYSPMTAVTAMTAI